jgi:hypothetical protein
LQLNQHTCMQLYLAANFQGPSSGSSLIIDRETMRKGSPATMAGRPNAAKRAVAAAGGPSRETDAENAVDAAFEAI